MSPQRGSGGAAADKAPNCLPHSDCLPTKASCWSLPCNPLITGEEKELGTGGAEKKGRGGGGGGGGRISFGRRGSAPGMGSRAGAPSLGGMGMLRWWVSCHPPPPLPGMGMMSLGVALVTACVAPWAPGDAACGALPMWGPGTGTGDGDRVWGEV